MSSLDDLITFEAELDRTVEALPIIQLPSRVFLSCYFTAVDAQMRGARLGSRVPANLEIGMAFSGGLERIQSGRNRRSSARHGKSLAAAG